MFRKTVLALALPALFVTSAAVAQQAGPTPGPKSGDPATIPFMTRNDIRTFDSTDDGDGVYIQDARRNWYYVTFFGRCNELPWAIGVGFKTFAGGFQIDRGDTIIAGRERCRIADIVHSGPPPAKAAKAGKAKGA
ncbi:hypothetical protein CAP40_03775 [Sphingomonas sp. IBVSS2]|uniref:DUF6491 family protein n=1 Tax=Sphingomonas sp. IBVSS2 TaxID=1985172 RepID=UPI000A2DBA3E|nr:DUF6491 family protein [Sphingomonas sp. IBVSS2]OSZ69962.1 hypothetical protein CAP40_03775 [Sphingomonas sp. IBVSS2]